MQETAVVTLRFVDSSQPYECGYHPSSTGHALAPNGQAPPQVIVQDDFTQTAAVGVVVAKTWLT